MMGRPKLVVEGIDDKWSIIHLLIRHGIDYDSKPWPEKFPSIEDQDIDSRLSNISESGVEVLLDRLENNIQLSGGLPIGFVLDADSPLQSRWDSVKNHLSNVGVSDLPKMPPSEGFIGESETYRTKVGVWLMPDNQNDGKLETFLHTLIDEKDRLIDHAISATAEAKANGAEFSPNDAEKAQLHAWLAWQKEPGKPYGTAIRARFFKNESGPTATAFVAWFKKLYEIAGA
jgi:hypothetical protein